MALDLILFIAGLLLLYYGAESLVSGSSRLALSFGVNPLIVGMTIVAFATSMPEMTVTLMASLKGSSDIAAGNVIGSNLFNTLAVVGTAGLIAPAVLDAELVTRDLPVMFAFTGVLVVMAYGWGRRTGVINKAEGGVLLLAVACYLAYLVYSTPIFA